MYIPEVVKQDVLNVFVTSATDPIYGIRGSVPPEMFGAFGSYFSRSPKDFRANLWDAITGQLEDQDSEVTEEDLRWLANRDFREPYEALREGIGKSQDFFRKWYGKYSHKSIANTVYIPMVATDVSQLFARQLAYDPLAFFIEQSTRFVEWDGSKMYHDSEIMESDHKETYLSTLDHLSKAYYQLAEHATAFYEERNPFDEWKERQPDSVMRNSERFVANTYKKQIKGAALDVARFLLPQAAKTNIAWILDARSTEWDIAAWKGHPLNEMVDAAHFIERAAGELVPSLLKYTDGNPYYKDMLHDYGGDIVTGRYGVPDKGVEIISTEENCLDKVISHLLSRHNFEGTFEAVYNSVHGHMSFEKKMEILDRVTKNRGSHDEWVEHTGGAFDMAKITFSIRTDIGAVRDWRRHQKWDRNEGLYEMNNAVPRPHMIDNMDPEAGEIFDQAISTAHHAQEELKRDFPHQAQYVVPMATKHEITMSAGLDQLQYMLWTRTTPEGNWSYREDAFNIAQAVLEKHPWLWGYKRFPKGKSLEKIYEEAPLKNVLRLQFGDTALHT